MSWQPIFGKIGKMTFIWQAGVPKRQGIWQLQLKKIFNTNIVATFCANMSKIGPVTQDIARVTTAPFWTRRQKSAYLIKYLSN